ncbi:hypothetical protein [Halorarum salinum]|uniref:HIT zinc finger n=1 Tax=Halorarum salinum TaxID=2743089 RepID=A0A7D5LCK5_9EURY|nr:hypothetical protein [Halobaculum salinum]QLG63371.1 hypothetical protein HUG12_17175 [Halobaculum salinum]
MSVGGLCQICEAKEGRFTCDNCGALVCADHYDESEGFCARCAGTIEEGGPGRTLE